MNAEPDIGQKLGHFLEMQYGEPVAVTDCKTVSGGYSRITTFFRARTPEGDKAFVARAEPPPDRAFFDELYTRREWALLKELTQQGRQFLPAARWVDLDGAVLGSPTIIMDFVTGETVPAAAGTGTELPRLADQVCGLAAQIHAVEPACLSDAVEAPTEWATYLDSRIRHWRQIEDSFIQADPFMRMVGCWLDRNRPEPAPMTLVHGDFQLPNMMLGESGPIAIDWESAHIGDPREDLGWLRFMERLSPPALYGRDEAAFCDRYRAATGLGADIVNPTSVAYFSVIALGWVYGGLLRQIAQFTAGANRSMAVAYTASASIAATHEEWYRMVTASLEEVVM